VTLELSDKQSRPCESHDGEIEPTNSNCLSRSLTEYYIPISAASKSRATVVPERFKSFKSSSLYG
jgi:hypothetical protein